MAWATTKQLLIPDPDKHLADQEQHSSLPLIISSEDVAPQKISSVKVRQQNPPRISILFFLNIFAEHGTFDQNGITKQQAFWKNTDAENRQYFNSRGLQQIGTLF